ncbi:MAG: DnaB-like helicase C-terminal domain-containing protein [Candidatus Ozemobacteraceae bacterium]
MRKLIGITGEISREAFEPQAEAENLLDQAEQKVLALSHFRVTSPYVKIKDLVAETFNRLEHLHEHKQSITGIATGFKKLDEYTAGFQPSDLIIVAARPSMGKTAFCLNIAMHVAGTAQIPVMIFSLEMSRGSLVSRLMCSEARIDGQKMRRGFLGEEDWTKLTMRAGTLSNAPILIDDSPGVTLLELRGKARRCRHLPVSG